MHDNVDLHPIGISSPLNAAQEGILYEVLQRDSLTPVYIVQMIFSINGTLNVQAFMNAFDTIVNRHKVLRSALSSESISAEQVTYSQVQVTKKFYDYSHFNLEERDSQLNQFLETDFQTTIPLTKAPLMRLALFMFEYNDYRLVWTRHHLLMDGNSVELFITELFAAYKALDEGEKIKLPALVEYPTRGDFRTNSERAKSYWQTQLRNYNDYAQLPPSSRENAEMKKTSQLSTSIVQNEFDRIREFIDENGLTVSTLLYAAWAITLYHYSGNTRVVFGGVKALPGQLNLYDIGLNINTLPFSIDIDPEMKVSDFLKMLRKKGKEQKEFTDTPLRKIKEWCNIGIEMPLFRSIIDYKPYSINSVIKGKFGNIDCKTAFKLNVPYPIMLEIVKEDGLQMDFYYDVERFEKTYMLSIIEHFKEVLLSLAREQTCCISDLNSLSGADEKIIDAANATEETLNENDVVSLVFEKQVAINPCATAVVYQGVTLSYRQLNESSNQIAHYLVEQGVSFEVPIAVFMKPNQHIMVAIMAVLKAGGVYVPIDPSHPSERVKKLLLDVKPAVIITENQYLHLLGEADKQSRIIDMDTPLWNEKNIVNPKLPLTANMPAYIIYTSGSTGEPKGVMIEHRSVVNVARACTSRLGVTVNSRILQIASFNFDVSVAEWALALLNGASLYIMDKNRFSPDMVAKELKERNITTIILASSILEIIPKQDFPALKTIAFGGEPCSQETVSFWSKSCLMANVYGLTEASICSTMSINYIEPLRQSNIGKPLNNTRIYVLDSLLREMPVGGVGEIYVAGVGLAKEYVNNKSLTNKAFLTVTITRKGKKFQERVYKTGDYGRWLHNGDIEYHGRIDEQVKMKGHRVELAEIEKAVEQFPGVNKAIVLFEDIGGVKSFLAFFKTTGEILGDSIKKFLLTKLPLYMIPQHFFKINEIPLTNNGKLYKQKLLEQWMEMNSLEENIPQPHIKNINVEITKVAEIILGHKNFKEDQNFQDAGFDSISLLNFSELLSKRFMKKIDVLLLFSYPTVNKLAGFLEKCDNALKLDIAKRQKNIPKVRRIEFLDE